MEGVLVSPDPCPSSKKSSSAIFQGSAKLPFGSGMIRYYRQY